MKPLNKLLVIVFLFTLSSCGEEFLDIRRNANQVIPQSITDYQAVIDVHSTSTTPAVGLSFLGSDEYFITSDIWRALSNKYERNGYVLANEVYEGDEGRDWNNAYQRILYANLALDVRGITPDAHEQDAWNNVVGSALFYRALNYYQLAQLFCKPYMEETAAKDLGIPLRLDYDVTKKVGRGTVKEVYDRIIQDLEESIQLLPEVAINKFRPVRAAACLLMSRVYLQMGNYQRSEYYATMGLHSRNQLIDFNTLDKSLDYTFPADYGMSNPEVLLYWRGSMGILTESRFNADTSLLSMYEAHDLRRHIYFRELTDGRVIFKGSYSSRSVYFVGLAIDELWLIRAECNARLGNLADALDDLNHLRQHRHFSESFAPLQATNSDDVLRLILKERRKELFMRGSRWEDMRRLNKEPEFATSIIRNIDGEIYELRPGDNKWVWPIPDNEIELSALEQNPR